jgi:hypothetical protein
MRRFVILSTLFAFAFSVAFGWSAPGSRALVFHEDGGKRSASSFSPLDLYRDFRDDRAAAERDYFQRDVEYYFGGALVEILEDMATASYLPVRIGAGEGFRGGKPGRPFSIICRFYPGPGSKMEDTRDYAEWAIGSEEFLDYAAYFIESDSESVTYGCEGRP